MTTEEVVRVVRLRTAVRTGEAQRIREEAGASFRLMAEAIGVAPATVHRWESGERVPHARHALAYLDLLEALEAQASEAVPA